MSRPPQRDIPTAMEEDPPQEGLEKADGSVHNVNAAPTAVASGALPIAPCTQTAEGDKADTGAAEQPKDAPEHTELADWRDLLWDALHTSAPPSSFFCSGRLQPPCLCPDVSVAGVGRLGLPLSKQQAVALKTVAEQAPHGKGFKTVVDTAVRDGLQIDASHVHIASSWYPELKSTVSKIARALDLDDNDACTIEARLYKLLLYEQGGHFIAHQDTEKERGMIGTLVVQLPTAEGHTGGSLTVRHKGEQFTHHFAEDSSSSLQYAAFFADCEHELSPITSGLRLVLVYNLVWVGAPAGAAPCETPVPGRHLVTKSPAEVQLSRALQAWQQDIDRGGGQKRIAVLLDHKYTQANLCFNHLKGADRAMVRVLSTCKGLVAHLVLVTWRTRVSFESDYDEEEEERRDKKRKKKVTTTGKWIAQDGSVVDYGAIDPVTDFFDPGDNELFDDDDTADSEDWEGYTGNEGTAVNKTYRRALLVLWPRSQTLQHARQAGFAAVLSVLQLHIADSAASTTDVPHNTVALGEIADHSRNGSGHIAACADALAALQACTLLLESPPPQLGRSRRESSSKPNITAVLQLAVKAVRLGIQGAAELLQTLVTLASTASEGLADAALAEALGAAAGVLEAAAVGPSLSQLVARCMVQQPKNCIILIQGVSAHPELQTQLAMAALTAAPDTMVDDLCLLVSTIPGLPELQQQVVNKLVAALQSQQSGEVLDQVAAALPRLDQFPHLQQQVTAAAAAAVMSAGPMQHLSSCIHLLSPSEQHEDMRIQLIQAIAAAMHNKRAVWQASAVLQLAAAVKGTPDLCGLIQATTAGSLFSNDVLLSQQTDDSMLQLCSMMLSSDQLRAAFFSGFATAVTARPDNYSLLKQLIQSAQVHAALAMPEVQQLVSCQIANLERMTVVPPFSWHMPEAKLPSEPEVEAFLRGPDQIYTMPNFYSFGETRKVARGLQHGRYDDHCYFGTGADSTESGDSSTYSFTTTAARGDHDFAVVTKTRGWYQRLLIKKQQLQEELQAMKALKL